MHTKPHLKIDHALTAVHEAPANYSALLDNHVDNHDDEVIEHALDILSRRMRKTEWTVSSPSAVKKYLTVKLSQAEREIFSIIWLDVKNRVLSHEDLAYGSITHCSVHPREVVKAGLRQNAVASILVHNHPSGSPDPSEGDRLLTTALKTALALVDIRVSDHIIVAGVSTYSFAEHGLI